MRDRIRAAVEMVLGNMGEGWFLIIEEPENEKFVQFALDEEAGLIFDLPFQALTDDEIEKARPVLGALGVNAVEVSDFSSFQADIGKDVEFAVKVAIAVFCEVFGLNEGTHLDITINR